MPAASISRSRSGGSAAARVRWDRLGRLAMLFVLAALLYLYVSAGVRMFTTWRQEHGERSAVLVLERENARLTYQHEFLSRAGTLEVEARGLNMMKSGEQPYIVSGLPNN